MENSIIEEIWKDIPEYEGYYQASNLGRIKSVERTIKGRWGVTKRKETIRKFSYHKFGYPQLNLSKEGIIVHELAHRLVAKTFLCFPIPEGMEIAHDDGNPRNIKLDNLKVSTPIENQADKWKHGTQPHGENHVFAKYSDEFCLSIIEELETSASSIKELAKKFNCSRDLISDLKNNKTRKYLNRK